MNKEYLNLLEKHINLFNEKLGKKISTEDFNELTEDINYIYSEIEKEKDYLKEHKILTEIGMHSIGMLSFVFKDTPTIIIAKEINEKKIVHNTLSALLAQLTNGILGILRLTDAGLDYQARVLFRSVSELSWLITSLIYDIDLLEKYIQGEKYPELFKPYRLRSKLLEIDNNTHLPKKLKNKLKSIRKETFSFYSAITHNSYPNPVLGTWVQGFERNDWFEFNLFGKISIASKQTISEVNKCIFLFLLMFYRALIDIHNFKAKQDDDFFISRASILKETFIEGYLLTMKE